MEVAPCYKVLTVIKLPSAYIVYPFALFTVRIETLSKPSPKGTLGKSSRRYKLITPKTAVWAYWGC